MDTLTCLYDDGRSYLYFGGSIEGGSIEAEPDLRLLG